MANIFVFPLVILLCILENKTKQNKTTTKKTPQHYLTYYSMHTENQDYKKHLMPCVNSYKQQ